MSLNWTGGANNPVTLQSKLQDLEFWEAQARRYIAEGQITLAKCADARYELENNND